MTGHHGGGTPVGDAARDDTALDAGGYVGKHRADDQDGDTDDD